MDAKDLRTESAVSERNNDGSKYSQGGGIALHCDRNKLYQDIGSNSLGKVDVPNARPCAVIGPDRVVPPPAASEAYHIKKGSVEPWPCMDNAYRRPPEYPHKLTNYQNPTRNISPRQTFQENMQRIMVPPTYNSVKVNEDTNYAQVPDRSNGLSKNIKLNMPSESKFCDVPYAVNPTNNEHKNVRNPEMCLPSGNPAHTRTAPHVWPPGSVNLRSTRMYSAPELYQYQDYPSCAGPRPVVPRPHRTVTDDQGYVYADPYYQEGNLRFKPYPTSKERYPQHRYEYIGNYSNAFHPPPGFPTHKYEVQKPMAPHPYPPYPPIKYLDNRVADPVIEGYQRNPQGLGPNYNIQYRNQVIHPSYGPVAGNSPQSKMHSYPPDAHLKSIPPNKLPYDSNAKAYLEYENSRPKVYPPSETYFINEMAGMPMKSQVIMPNYSALNMHNIPLNPYYKKDTQHIKNYEHMAHFRNIDPNINIHNQMSRHAPVFSPNTLAISPTDSNTSNDTTQTLGTSQEDCGYVSQSSTASVRSIDSGINRIPNEYLRKYYENRYGPIARTSPMILKSQLHSNNNNTSKDKKQIDVRQFLQMWNEGDEEQEENGPKEITIQTVSIDKNNFSKSQQHEAMNSQQSQEQLYVLGLVNVPSEELAKYEHIQKVSKLPENIKGYNSIELLNQFEEVIESSQMKNYKSPAPKESMYQIPMKGGHLKQATGIIPPRPVSPLDVEAKISQSVIHKDVGCNFEIKPCSPKMLNVEVAAPVQNILAERSIEKVANPVMLRSPMLSGMNENIDCNRLKRSDHRMNMNENLIIPSCKMINTQFSNSNSIDQMKNSYTIQDLESNSGLCLASLPRLDNDIELNFPEVNQQFINANKGDKTALANLMRDLPTLEVLDQSPNQVKDKFNNTNPSRLEYDLDKSLYTVDSETEFSKLSKYRKSKIFEPKETVKQHNVNALRTDSVIIKNPENNKNYEENSDFTKGIIDIQQAPINLTSQGSISSTLENAPNNINLHDAGKEKQLPVEIAIDFSLNKTGILNHECIDTNIGPQLNNLTCMEESPLKTLNHNKSPDSIDLLPVITEENENSGNTNNIDINCSLDSVNNSQDVSKPVAVINNKNNNNEVFEEIPACIKRYQNIEGRPQKITSNLADESIVDVSNARSVSKTDIPHICNSEDLTRAELTEESKYTLSDSHSKMASNLSQSLEDEYKINNIENTRNVAIDKDFSDCHNFVDKLNFRVSTESDFDVSDINNAREIIDPMVTEQSQEPDIKAFISSDEMCSNGYASPDLNSSTESQTILKDYANDHTNSNDNIEDSTSQTTEDLSNHEIQLKDYEDIYHEDTQSSLKNFKEFDCDETTQSSQEHFEETHCEDTQSSLDIPDLCDQSGNKDLEHKLEQPFRRNIWYGSKELYSPRIQNLLTFSEGNCNINNMDSKNGVLVDSTVIITTTDNNDDHVVSDLDMDDKSVALEVTVKNNYHYDEFNFERIKSVETEKAVKENNYLEFEVKKSVPKKEVTTENNKCDDSEFEMKIILPIEELTTENNETDVNHFDIEKTVPIVTTESDTEHKKYDFKMSNSIQIEEPTAENNEKDTNSNFETINSIPIDNVTTENDHDDYDFEIIRSVPQEVTPENNDNQDDSVSEVNKAGLILEASSENINYDYSHGEIRKSAQQEITTENNNDHDGSNLVVKKSEPLLEADTKNIDYDDSNCAIKTTARLEDLTKNNKDLNDSEPQQEDIDHDDCNLEIRKSKPGEVTTESKDGIYSSFEKRKPICSIVEETAGNSDDKDDSVCMINKPVPMEEVSLKYVTEKLNEEQYRYNDKLEKIVTATSVLNLPVLDKNLKETVKSENHFESVVMNKNEAINHKINKCAVDHAVNSPAADGSLATLKFKETNSIRPSVESESGNNENTHISETQVSSDIKSQCEAIDTPSIEDVLCESFQEESENCGEQPEGYEGDAELESSGHFNHMRFSFNGQANDISFKKSQRLKRSLSDSALNMYNSDERNKQDSEENVQFIWPFKRRKIDTVQNDLLAQNLCSIINHNRRNSVSSFYNEDNVSFCILIDNSCIITEEENEEPEKCYTELSEECLAEVQSSCTKQDENIETMTEVVLSPQHEKLCANSDSFELDTEDDKTLEESWDEDVGCVETVISDDIAEDIEIYEPSSFKDDASSDNDESGVFSCSDHTDKVKFIYGDKMCNDDALFVETLYKTPQMDVNKTLYNRESRISEEYNTYYDNDSLEKMLSESNEPSVSPYVPQYLDAIFPSGKVNSKETPENKENMDMETYSPFQNKKNALDIVVDINADKNVRENRQLTEVFAKTRDDTALSCESSLDNVFTYNQKEEDAVYTSSSPEVSSTTSEEKNSGILLKITNYQGSRISQINDISRVTKRSSCKFTEEKEYLHSHANYSSNRPLITKAAQKYIPPLRESIRDLKVKLSLPQHSLMKLKQLKISKDEPKVNKQSAINPRIPKKPKPKFEDVLKSIDEIQFKKHKEKSKKAKKAIPKVVIKKNRNGSHYASTSNKNDFNPDLTGRKWQPWVFLEKNNFIDKMAIRNQTKAVYSHRKKTYVLAEKFQKYRSASSAKFVISPPISDNPSAGLKYTIRLKHNY